MADLAIEVHDVAKRFRLVHERNSTLKAAIFSGFKRSVHEEFWALDDVSFDVPQGSTFALIGENGSGKSTMLKCLAKIYRPDRGTIRTVGKVSALLELGAGFPSRALGPRERLPQRLDPRPRQDARSTNGSTRSSSSPGSLGSSTPR